MIVPELSTAEVVATFNDIDGFVSGNTLPLPTEDGGSSSIASYLDSIKAKVNAKNAEVAAAPQNGKLRAELTYLSAIYRDSIYNLLGRGQLLERSLNNEYYEAAQVGYDAVNAERSKIN
jgi:hypothetical protein